MSVISGLLWLMSSGAVLFWRYKGGGELRIGREHILSHPLNVHGNYKQDKKTDIAYRSEKLNQCRSALNLISNWRPSGNSSGCKKTSGVIEVHLKTHFWLYLFKSFPAECMSSVNLWTLVSHWIKKICFFCHKVLTHNNVIIFIVDSDFLLTVLLVWAAQ